MYNIDKYKCDVNCGMLNMDRSKCIEILKALSDDTRLEIFEILQNEKLCACKILERLNITQPTLSHHMKILCECEIVIAEKNWRWNYYSINCKTLNELIKYLSNAICFKQGESNYGLYA